MNRDIEYRYFRLTGQLRKESEEWRNTVYAEYRFNIKQFCDEVGTEEILTRHGLVGFREVEGKNIPGTRPAKDFPGYLQPNMRTKAGKALSEKMRGASQPKNVGLQRKIAPHSPWIVNGNQLVSMGFSYFSHTKEYYVLIPKEIEYEPHPEMVELKQWEYLKAIDSSEVSSVESKCS